MEVRIKRNKLILIFSIITFFKLAGCSHLPKEQTHSCASEWCGHRFVELTKIEETPENFPKLLESYKKGCDNHHALSCTQMGYIYFEKKDMKNAELFSLRGCRLGDEMGCYNYACSLCKNKKNEEAFTYLEKSFHMGGKNWKNRIKDPDLSCLKAEQKKLITEKWSNEEKHNFPMTPFHIISPENSSSVTVPLMDVKMEVVNYSPFIMASGRNYLFAHIYAPKEEFIIPGRQITETISKEYFKKNGFESNLFVFNSINHQKEKNIIIGSSSRLPKGYMTTLAIFPEAKKDELLESVKLMVLSSVFNFGMGLDLEKTNINFNTLKKFNLDFYERYSGGMLFLPQGVGHEQLHQFPHLYLKLIQFEGNEESIIKKSYDDNFDLQNVVQKKKITHPKLSAKDHFFKFQHNAFSLTKPTWLYKGFKKVDKKTTVTVDFFSPNELSDESFVELLNNLIKKSP